VGTNAEELNDHLDHKEAAEGLVRWSEVTLREIVVPARSWRKSGPAGALLTELYVKERSAPVRLAVVKVLPPHQTHEPQAHRRALDEAPDDFRPHLVEQIFDPLMLPSGGIVTFQGLAGRSGRWRPMADLAIHRAPAACEVVVRSLISRWNHDFGLTRLTVLDFLRHEIDDLESVSAYVRAAGPGAQRARLHTDGGPALPNPLRLVLEGGPLAAQRLDFVSGRVHGDLHHGNVLMEQGHDFDQLGTFALVDLAEYESAGQLGRDLVVLLLSTIARVLPDLSESQRQVLLTTFVRPETEPTGQLPQLAVDILRAVYRPASELLDSCPPEAWYYQYLLSLVAHGLNFTTLTHLGLDCRWWFYQLAGHAARELLHELDASDDAPGLDPYLNDFPITSPTVPTPRGRHAAALAGWPRDPKPGVAQ
jgi:hypothetical protein